MTLFFGMGVISQVQAGGGIDADIQHLGATQGGQALKAVVYEWTATNPKTPWVGGSFEFKIENPTEGSTCETKQSVSNGAGEVYGSCLSSDGQPIMVYLQQSGTPNRSVSFQITPIPVSSPVSPPGYEQPPISAPVLPITPPTNGPVLQIVTDTLPNGIFSKSYQATFKALSSSVDYPIVASFSGVPQGLTVSCEEGVEFLRARRAASCYFRGTPTQHGNYTVQAVVTAGVSTVSKQFAVSITNRPVMLQVSNLGNGKVGQSYKATVKAVDPDLNDSLEITIANLPQGLNTECSQGFNLLRTQLVKTCEISGTPSTQGVYQVSMTAKDQGGNQANQTVMVSILAAQGAVKTATASAKPPQVTTTTLKAGRTGLPYRAAIQGVAYAKQAAPTMQVTGLPDGITADCSSKLNFFHTKYDVSCELTGVREASASAVVTVTLTDALSQSHQALLGLEFVNKPVVLNTTSFSRARVNRAYKAQVIATDPDVMDNLNLQVLNLPAGLSVSCEQANTFFGLSRKATCSIEGTPTAIGVTPVELRVDDGAGHEVTRTVSLTVVK
jgi:phage major head subunit gpT-like protein